MNFVFSIATVLTICVMILSLSFAQPPYGDISSSKKACQNYAYRRISHDAKLKMERFESRASGEIKAWHDEKLPMLENQQATLPQNFLSNLKNKLNGITEQTKTSAKNCFDNVVKKGGEGLAASCYQIAYKPGEIRWTLNSGKFNGISDSIMRCYQEGLNLVYQKLDELTYEIREVSK